MENKSTGNNRKTRGTKRTMRGQTKRTIGGQKGTKETMGE
jgi:hypothetical protein